MVLASLKSFQSFFFEQFQGSFRASRRFLQLPCNFRAISELVKKKFNNNTTTRTVSAQCNWNTFPEQFQCSFRAVPDWMKPDCLLMRLNSSNDLLTQIGRSILNTDLIMADVTNAMRLNDLFTYTRHSPSNIVEIGVIETRGGCQPGESSRTSIRICWQRNEWQMSEHDQLINRNQSRPVGKPKPNWNRRVF